MTQLEYDALYDTEDDHSDLERAAHEWSDEDMETRFADWWPELLETELDDFDDDDEDDL